MKNSVLLIEDDIRLAEILKKDFQEEGFQVEITNKVSKLKSKIESLKNFSHAILDLRLEGGEFGLEAISLLKQENPEIKILVLSGYGSITTAVEAIKRGATDYLTKPASFSEILLAFEGKRLQSDQDLKRRSLHEVEHEYIDFLLTKNEGNISQTAKDLGLHRQSLQRKLKKYI